MPVCYPVVGYLGTRVRLSLIPSRTGRLRSYIMPDECEVLDGLIKELDDDYLTWYRIDVKSRRKGLSFWNYAAIFAGMLATIVVGITNIYNAIPLQIAAIILPAFGSAATIVIKQGKMEEELRKSEEGRIAYETLINFGTILAATARGNPQDCSKIHDWLFRECAAIESYQTGIEPGYRPVTPPQLASPTLSVALPPRPIPRKKKPKRETQ